MVDTTTPGQYRYYNITIGQYCKCSSLVALGNVSLIGKCLKYFMKNVFCVEESSGCYLIRLSTFIEALTQPSSQPAIN